MDWLALDIGGANLKLADGKGYAASYPFALWKDSQQLASELRTVITEAPHCDHLAVTMTGELADCFETKTEGVQFILGAMIEASDGRYLRVYLNDGKLVTAQVATVNPLPAASSNWHALATFCGRYAKTGSALLIDFGSTTCDIIPLTDGKPTTNSNTDTDRLLKGELVYTGLERSPICALIDVTPYRGKACPVAQELFATTRDAYITLGLLHESDSNTNTADGRPATKAAAHLRLGRMISASGEDFSAQDATAMAEAVARRQHEMLDNAIRKVASSLPKPPETIILSGHGEVVLRRVVTQLGTSSNVVSLNQKLGANASRCAPAHALASLAAEAAGL